MTREDGDALALELAKLAGLDASRMLEGQLVEDAEWSALVVGLTKLNERHPDKAGDIAALVERIDLAADMGSGRR